MKVSYGAVQASHFEKAYRYVVSVSSSPLPTEPTSTLVGRVPELL